MTCAVVPSPMKPNADVNSRNRPTANTSSGVTSGSSISTFGRPGAAAAPALQPERQRRPERRRRSASRAAASSSLLERRAQRRVVEHAQRRVLQNQRSDQPCADVRERPSLNANRIASSTGTSDHSDVDATVHDGASPAVAAARLTRVRLPLLARAGCAGSRA